MSDLVRRFIKVLIICSGVYLWFIFFYSDFKIVLKNISYSNKICKKPLTYKVVKVDEKFGVSTEEIKKILESSELIWEIPTQRELFKYTQSDNPDIQVYFVYDKRQETTDNLKNIAVGIDQKDQSLDIKKSFFENLRVEYQSHVSNYKNTLAEYNRGLAIYGELKSRYSSNGYSESEILDLNSKLSNIKNLEVTLSQKQQFLKNKESELKNQAGDVNKAVVELNTDISKYNVTTKTQPETFREGEYIRDNTGSKIYVYEFDSVNNLKRLFAHELGHALYIDHTDGIDSIMYSYNTSKSLELSNQDISALEDVCSKSSVLLERIKVLLNK